MSISISATNPCHLYELALALNQDRALSRYYSGYPAWKLRPPAGFPVVTRSARTLITYGFLRLPSRARPAPHRLFRWQDRGFDRAVATTLAGDRAGSLHAMPGQALETFRAARSRGIATVLNHASGPVRQQLSLVAEEYRRIGLQPSEHHAFDNDYFRREDAEYSLADRHCVASSIVRRQLVNSGVPHERVWIVPYAADPQKFFPPAPGEKRNPMQIVYAGQLSLRKGLRIAFAAMEQVYASSPVEFQLYGTVSREMHSTLASAADRPWLRLHSPVDQARLGDIFRHAALLVLPSWEEAFGLVVVQALSCGLPCVVSDRVGAADLIEHRRNGSIFPAGDHDALAREITWWLGNPAVFAHRPLTWRDSASRLIELSRGLQT